MGFDRRRTVSMLLTQARYDDALVREHAIPDAVAELADGRPMEIGELDGVLTWVLGYSRNRVVHVREELVA